MTSALRYEWRRISSVPGTWVIAALVVLIAAGLSTLFVAVGESDPVPARNLAAGLATPLSIGGFLFAAFGAQALGQEYRFGTIRSTLTLFPRRPTVFAAKYAVTALVTVAVLVLAAVVSVAVVAVGGWRLGFDGAPGGGVGGLAVRVVLVALGWLAWGFGIAGITRNTALGIVLPLVLAFVVETPLTVVLGQKAPWLVDLFPFGNAGAAVAMDGGAWGALGIFLLWAGAVAAAAYASFTYRDA
ncbi:ABC transporter permease [Longispora sp. NPDC051575]|uniref:ABC transporter permease n=1 Tax=Longispora sp. NPDC051575 TaxID=3154943 RepID=UPI00342B471F